MNHTQLLNVLVETMTQHAKDCNWVPRKWECVVDFDLSHLSKVSHGGLRDGNPYIMIALYPTLGGRFYEYASIAKDGEIGSFVGPTSRCVAALVAHEFAHAVCCSIKPNAKKTLTKNQVLSTEDVYGHGLLWKEIYRGLRVKFVNNMSYDLDANSIIAQSQENIKEFILKHQKINVPNNIINNILRNMGCENRDIEGLI